MSAYAKQLATLSEAIIDDRTDAMLPQIKITRADVITAEVRLAVYAGGYVERLRNAVLADYPTLAQYFGQDHLTQAIHAYIRQTPSRYWDLNNYPVRFGAFFAEESADRAAAALAILESAIAEVFWLPESAALEAAALANLSPEEFSEMHFKPRTALKLLKLDVAANDFLQAFRDGHAPTAISTHEEYLCVLRHANEVKRLNLTAPEHALLAALFKGKSFGEALEQVDDPNLAEQLPHYLARWLEYGFFAS
jgi:hypothetical protein